MASEILEKVEVDSFKAPQNSVGAAEAPKARLLGLGLVLVVALTEPILGNVAIFLGLASKRDALTQQFQLLNMIAIEVIALAVLWYVMTQQGTRWRDLGCSFKFLDPLTGLGLAVAGSMASGLAYYIVQIGFYSVTHHYLTPKSLHALVGYEVSAISLLFVCINPVFEELIVRAFVMSELKALGVAQWVAIAISIGLQISYHLYQGFLNVLALTAVFTLFSVYYAQKRRIMPVILAHFFYDLYALIRGVG